MIQPKNIAAAFALAGFVFAGSIANAEGFLDADFYIEAGILTANPDDAIDEFTRDNLAATWDLDRMTGAKAQIGGDFGHIRLDAKLRAMRGDINSISGTPGGTTTEDEAIIAVGTLNAYLDVYDIPVGEFFTITPYVGVGYGFAYGFMQANAAGAGVDRTDHRNDGGRAKVGMIGALFEVADTVGVTIEYERLDTGFSGQDNVNNVSAGIRLTF
jgi:outer membrane protein W